MALLPIRRGSADMSSMLEEMNRMMDACFSQPSRAMVREGLWHPTTDVYNRTEDIVVELELPGVKVNDVNISVEEDHLIVEGTRGRPGVYKEEDQYYLERAFGGFHRVIHLPASVHPDNAKATYSEGVLTITLPKTTRAKGKKISVTTK